MTNERSAPRLAGPEVETLRAFLDYHRDTLLAKVEGLSAAQLSQTHPPSALTLGGLLKHAALNEDWWFVRVLEGDDGQPDWVPQGAFDDDPDWEMTSAAADDPAELRRIFDSSLAAADAAIERALAQDGLDTLSPGGVGEEHRTRFSLRFILLHMIEEYARHNGHADLLREAVDGAVGE